MKTAKPKAKAAPAQRGGFAMAAAVPQVDKACSSPIEQPFEH